MAGWQPLPYLTGRARQRHIGRMPGAAIDTLTAADLDDIVDVWKDAGLPYRPSGRDAREAILAQIALPQCRFFGVRDGSGRLLGVVLVNHEGRKGWINRLAVRPEARRRGLARKLIAACESWLHAKGILIVAVCHGLAAVFDGLTPILLAFRSHFDPQVADLLEDQLDAGIEVAVVLWGSCHEATLARGTGAHQCPRDSTAGLLVSAADRHETGTVGARDHARADRHLSRRRPAARSPTRSRAIPRGSPSRRPTTSRSVGIKTG